ncbi:MAG: fumarylacetoacetate hydrolase family protein [Acidimicrobiales bacterium]
MRLVSFVPGDVSAVDPGSGVPDTRTGVVVGDEVVDLTDPGVGLPGDMAALLAAGSEAMARAAGAPTSAARRWPLAEVRLRAPVPSPPKVLAIGMNYRAHVEEMGRDLPPYQYWFNKQRTCVVGPGDPILVPVESDQVDYEGELAIVIGRRCKHVPADRWLDVVAGFTVMNDVSVRDWQGRTPTFTMGKSFDTHGPLGPAIVTADELGDPGSLRLRTWVDDELRQDSTTADLIFSCAEMIAYLTTVFPLEPGDVLSTGTPSGVGMGFSPPKWLRPGDRVRIEIESVGVLENPVEAAAAGSPVGLDG